MLVLYCLFEQNDIGSQINIIINRKLESWLDFFFDATFTLETFKKPMEKTNMTNV